MGSSLQRAEDAVAGVAEARDDVALVVEVVVNGRDVDGDVRVLRAKPAV